jgi:hypothetical protein
MEASKDGKNVKGDAEGNVSACDRVLGLQELLEHILCHAVDLQIVEAVSKTWHHMIRHLRKIQSLTRTVVHSMARK